MPCVNKVIHDFPDGAKVCVCGAAGLIEKPRIVVDSASPVCFVCGKYFVANEPQFVAAFGYHHETCNPKRVCKCGAKAPEGKIWHKTHVCQKPCDGQPHYDGVCYVPNPLYKPKPRTFTLAEVMELGDEVLVKACEKYVIRDFATIRPPLDWNFAMKCRDMAVQEDRAPRYRDNFFRLTLHNIIVETTPADYCRAALLTVAGE